MRFRYPQRKNTVFVVGFRLDASAAAYLGGDVNVEVYCNLPELGNMLLEPARSLFWEGLPRLPGRCGYFLNIGIEENLVPTAGSNVGLLIGTLEFPDSYGEYTDVYTLGGSLAAIGSGEADLTYSPGDGGIVFFIGVGAGVGTSPYTDQAISVYLGQTPEEALQTIRELRSILSQ